MPKTAQKTVKKSASRQGSAVKTRESTPKKSVPRARSSARRPARSPKKAKKGVSPDIWQALLLTGALIAVSTGIAIAVVGINQKNTQDVPMASITTLPEATKPLDQVELPAIAKTPPKEQVPALKPDTPSPAAKTPVSKPTKVVPVAVAPKASPSVKVPPAELPAASTPVKARTPKETPSVKALPPVPPPKVSQGTLVFVIDDAGNNLQELEPFLRFPGPLTIAVLPGLPHSAEAARRIRAAGKEVFLHQPMEAIGGQNPGPGAIYAEMDTDEVLAILRQNLAEIGPVTGMNNHQGSKITMDRQKMETVLAFCQEQGISFLDSRTTSETAVPAAARNLGIKIGERNIFIDNEQNRPSMNRFIENGLSVASRQGKAVMIGHTWSPELAPLLAELYQDFIAQGYTLAPASELIK